MAEIVRMPKLSDTMTEGVVAEWHKKVGDTVSEGDLLAEIETDKATMEFESFYDGVLLHIGVEKGGTAPVNDVLAVIGEKGEDVDAILKEDGGADSESSEKEEKAPEKEEKEEKESKADKSQEEKETKKESQPAASESNTSSESENGGRIIASPLAKKMAAEKGIDLSKVKGTGDNQRIIKRDIENYKPAANTGDGGSGGQIIYAPPAGEESYEDVPNSQMRKAIAKTLSSSKFSAPHFYLKMEVDMDNAITARKAINSQDGVKVSFNDIIIKAVAAALRRHPKVNADWIGDAIRYNNHIHVGVAVAVDEGLVVPVVKFTDTKGIAQIGAEIKDLASRARDKKIKPDEMQGGTFAVSNLGMYGIEDFTSIINPPNGCILSVGQIKQTPVIKDGQIVPGNVMMLSLSCDHRVVDGAIGSDFLKTLKGLLENPVNMLV